MPLPKQKKTPKKIYKIGGDESVIFFNTDGDNYSYDEALKQLDDEAFFTEQIATKENNTELNYIFNSVKDESPIKTEKIESITMDEAKARLTLDSDVIHTFTNVIEKDQELKSKYAIGLIVAFIIQLIAYNFIFFLVGLGKLKFGEITLDLYVTGGIIEVIATIKIIVSYLFKDNITEPLKHVLEKNKTNK